MEEEEIMPSGGTETILLAEDNEGDVILTKRMLRRANIRCKLEVTPDTVAKVILNERTGTVVMGEYVRISTVAVAHGNLSIQIKERSAVSQPLPFAPAAPSGTPPTAVPPGTSPGTLVVPGGATVVTPESSVSVKEEGQPLMIVQSGVSLGEVIKALNAIGATPRDLISILQSIKAAGALQADLEII